MRSRRLVRSSLLPPCVLTIAGSDSGAGAGIQADARAIHALGGYACTAVTAITAQNLHGVKAWQAVSASLLAAQIEAVLADFPIGAVKTGLLPGAASVRVLARLLRRKPRLPLVVDPVIASTSGTRFLSRSGLLLLQNELFPLATLLTPNWPEAAILSGRPVTDEATAVAAARAILDAGCPAVLVKGGHAPGARCDDLLVQADGTVTRFEGRRVKTPHTHGTGCVLSAVIATGLARHLSLIEAIGQAKDFLLSSLKAGRRMTWPGRGPAVP